MLNLKYSNLGFFRIFKKWRQAGGMPFSSCQDNQLVQQFYIGGHMTWMCGSQGENVWDWVSLMYVQRAGFSQTVLRLWGAAEEAKVAYEGPVTQV